MVRVPPLWQMGGLVSFKHDELIWRQRLWAWSYICVHQINVGPIFTLLLPLICFSPTYVTNVKLNIMFQCVHAGNIQSVLSTFLLKTAAWCWKQQWVGRICEFLTTGHTNVVIWSIGNAKILLIAVLLIHLVNIKDCNWTEDPLLLTWHFEIMYMCALTSPYEKQVNTCMSALTQTHSLPGGQHTHTHIDILG